MAGTKIEFDAVVSASQINRMLADLRTDAEGAAKAINDALGGTVTKKIVLQDEVDERGTRKLIAVERERLSVADQIINRQRTLDKVQRGSAVSIRQQLTEAVQARNSVQRYADAIGGVSGKLGKQREEWTALNAKVSRLSRELAVAEASGFWQQIKIATNTQGLINIGNGLTNITQGLQAASIVVGQFFGAINQVIDTAAQLQSFKLAFEAIGAGSAGATTALQETSRIALGLGVDINTVQEGFKQLSPVILNTGGSISDVSAITESLSSRFAAFGISGDKARRVMNGVIQAFAKGKLQAEELTQQISEADPAFKTDLAQALLKARGSLGELGKEVDGSTANLERLVKEGKITAEVLRAVLPGLSKSSLLFGKLGSSGASAIAALQRNAVTIDQVRNNLKNLNQISLRNLATSAEPLIIAFLKAQAAVTDFFSRISKSPAIASFAKLGAKAVDIIVKIADTFFVLAEGVVQVASAFNPLLSVLANVPGLATIAGVALAGKLLGPLKLLDGRIKTARDAWLGFADSIKGAFVAPASEIKTVTAEIKAVQSQLLRPQVTPGASVAIAPSATRQLTDNIEQIGRAASGQIERQIDVLEKRAERIGVKLEAATKPKQAKPAGEDPRAANLRAIIASNERDQAVLQKSINIANIAAKETSKIDLDPQAAVKLFQQRITDIVDELGKKIGREITVPDLDIDKKIESVSQALDPFKLDALTGFLNSQIKESLALGEELKNLDPKSFEGIADFDKVLEKKLVNLVDIVGKIGGISKAVGEKGGDIGAVIGSAISIEPEQGKSIEDLQKQLIALQDKTFKAKSELTELASAATDKAASSGFTEKEIKRQNKLQSELDETKRKIRELTSELKAEQSAAQRATTQQRRQAVGFDPDSSRAIRQATEEYATTQRRLATQQRLEDDPGLEKIEDRRDDLLKRLASIDRQKIGISEQGKNLAAGFPFLGIKPEEFGVEALARLDAEAEKLIGRLNRLEDARTGLIVKAEQQALAETNIADILKQGSDESATFAQKQKALAASIDIFTLAQQKNSQATAEAEARLQKLTAARDRLAARTITPESAARIQEAGARPFQGIANDSKQTSESIENLDSKIEAAKEALSGLKREGEGLNTRLKELNATAGVNSKAINTTGNAFKRFGTAIGGTVVGALKGGLGALKGLASGAVGLIGLLDPLTAIFLAAGLGARLYADGTKDATAAAARFKDQANALSAAIRDLNPSQKEAEQQSTVLSRAWDKLAFAAVKIGNAFGSAFEGIGKKLESFAAALKNSGSIISDEFTNIAGSVGLVAGLGTLGALIGSIVAPGAGTVIGGAIGGLVGVLASIALGADEASIKLSKLKEELKAVTTGSNIVTAESKKLAAELTKLSQSQGKNISGETLTKLREGLNTLKSTVASTEKEISGLQGTLANNKNEIKSNEAEISKLQSKLDGLTARSLEIQRDPLTPMIPGANKELDELGKQIRATTNSLNFYKGINSSLETSNGQLNNSIINLKDNLQQQEAAVTRVGNSIQKADKQYFAFINTISKIEEQIKKLQDQNKGLNFTNPKDAVTLDANLERIKRLQLLLETVSKTRYEIEVEVIQLRGQIQAAQDRIDFEPGVTRDTRNALREASESIFLAQKEFQQKAENFKKLAAEASNFQKQGAAATELAGLKFLEATRKSAAELADAGRSLQEKLQDAQKSLINLTLSKPEFFSQEELNKNAEKIDKAFAETVNKTGFTPEIKGDTVNEILAFKQGFIEARNEADKLTNSINEITTSLSDITRLLAKIAGVELSTLRQYGVDVNKIIGKSNSGLEESKSNMQSIAKATPRIGDIVGTISGGGRDFVLYFDNVTKQVEEVTGAQFKALRAADKLAVAGEKIGTGFSSGSQKAISGISNIGKRVGSDFEKALSTLQSINSLRPGNNTPQRVAPITGSAVISPVNQQSEQATNSQMAELGRRNGGSYLAALEETIRTGGTVSMQDSQLASLVADTSRYRTALDSVYIAQNQVSQAQDAYNAAIASGVTETAALSSNLENARAALGSASIELDSAKASFAETSNLAKQYGIDLNSIPSAGETISGTSPANPESAAIPAAISQWGQYVNAVTSGVQTVSASIGSDPLSSLPQDTAVNTSSAIAKWNQYVNSVVAGTQSIKNNAGQSIPVPTLSSQPQAQGQQSSELNQIAKVQTASQNSNQKRIEEIRQRITAIIKAAEAEKEAIKRNDELASAASSRRIQGLNELANLSRQAAEVDIARLEELTPAEEKLARIRREDLKRQASKGGTAGLEAQAQLDQLNRAEKISKVKQKQAEREKAIQEEIKKATIAEEERKIKAKEVEQQIENNIRNAKLELINKEKKHAAEMTKRQEAMQDQQIQSLKTIADSLKAQKTESSNVLKAQEESVSAIQEGARAVSGQLLPSMTEAARQAQIIANAIKGLDDKVVNVHVNHVSTPGRWAGGPVEAGKSYRVNEIGQEGFLSSTGRLAAISKPKNAIWTAPSSGTVIPANMWKRIEAPKQGVSINRNIAPVDNSKDTNELAQIARQIDVSIRSANASNNYNELAVVQAQQAIEIGKLSHAVDRLVSKDWNVHVGVTSTSGPTFLSSLNYRL